MHLKDFCLPNAHRLPTALCGMNTYTFLFYEMSPGMIFISSYGTNESTKYMHTCTEPRTRAHTHARTHARTLARSHARTHARTHAYLSLVNGNRHTYVVICNATFSVHRRYFNFLFLACTLFSFATILHCAC